MDKPHRLFFIANLIAAIFGVGALLYAVSIGLNWSEDWVVLLLFFLIVTLSGSRAFYHYKKSLIS